MANYNVRRSRHNTLRKRMPVSRSGTRPKECSSQSIGLWLKDECICEPGYTTLDKCPEIMTSCTKIAQLIGTITIHLMANGKNGDERIINELSRKIDIEPCYGMVRKTWIEAIVMNLLLYGSGNSVVRVHTSDGLIGDMEPIQGYRVGFISEPNDYHYKITIDGVAYDSDELMHFVLNPDQYEPWKGRGITVGLREIANDLKQAAATKKGFLESNWKPSIIIKVDAMTEELSSKEGRQEILESYIETNEAGKPWIIPAEQFQIEQVRPLTLNDLAISDVVKLDKQTVASIIGVPSFILGVGDFNREEWNLFVNTTVKSIVMGIQQEMTKKLILSPKMYLRFNYWSILNWDLQTISNVLLAGSDRGYVCGNEWRDRMNLEPVEDLNEFRILENYIPVDMSDKQKKLIQKEDSSE